jgi:hypothetical protein
VHKQVDKAVAQPVAERILRVVFQSEHEYALVVIYHEREVRGRIGFSGAGHVVHHAELHGKAGRWKMQCREVCGVGRTTFGELLCEPVQPNRSAIGRRSDEEVRGVKKPEAVPRKWERTIERGGAILCKS